MTARRVVIVGGGMAGNRLAEEIADRDRNGLIHLTLLSAEAHRPYNRARLTDVLAGEVAESGIELPEPGGRPVLRLGVAVVAVDRVNRCVRRQDGTTVPYDILVLATGAEPLIPPIPDLRTPAGELRPGMFAFRTLDDCRALIAAAGGARHAAVVGGGVLGLETARALAARGPAVQVLHAAPWLMERQLDADASRFLRRAYAEIGIDVRVGMAAVGVSGADRADGRVDGLILDNGERLPADLVVFSCGVRPRAGLAEACDLDVERGIVVGDDLRTSDPRIYAIGDCAQHKDAVSGLAEPAWEQARVLAERLTGPGADVRYVATPPLTRLKARGVDLLAMGETGAQPGAQTGTQSRPLAAGIEAGMDEVVLFSDARAGVYKKLVIRGDRLVGAVLMGDDTTNGTVTQFIDRGTPVPPDPKVLLFAGLRSLAGDRLASAPSDETTVCRCNGVTRGEIVRVFNEGARSLDAVAEALRCGTGCGSCRADVTDIITGLDDSESAA